MLVSCLLPSLMADALGLHPSSMAKIGITSAAVLHMLLYPRHRNGGPLAQPLRNRSSVEREMEEVNHARSASHPLFISTLEKAHDGGLSGTPGFVTRLPLDKSEEAKE